MPAADQSGHIQHGADLRPATGNSALSPVLAAVLIERRYADQAGDLLAVQVTQLWHLGQHRHGQDLTDAFDPSQKLVFRQPRRVGIDQ